MNTNSLQVASALTGSLFIRFSREFLLPTSGLFILGSIFLNLFGSALDIPEEFIAISYALILVIFTQALGYKVSQDDFDSNAVLFLESLPVQKWTVFIARFVAAYFALMICAAICYLCLASLFPEDLPINTYDFSHSPALGYWFIIAFGSLAITTLMTSIPSLSVIIIIVFYLTFMLLSSMVNNTWGIFIPSLGFLEVMSLFPQTHWLILLTGGTCLGLSFLIFRLKVSRMIQGSSIKKRRRKLKKKPLIIIGSLALAVIIGMLTISSLVMNIGDDNLVVSGETELETKIQVGNFVVRFPEGKSKPINKFINDLPQIDANIRNLIGADIPAEDIELIFTRKLPHHAAGIMNGNIIRIGIGGIKKKRETLRTVAHEIAHVYIERLTESVASTRFNKEGQLMHEGCAEWVASRLYPQKDGYASDYTSFRASLLWGDFKIDKIFNNDELSEKWGDVGVYVLGPMYIESIIKAGEEDCSIKDILIAYTEAYEENPKDAFLWPETLSKLDRNIPALRETFYTQLNEFRDSNNILPANLSDRPPVEYRRINGDLEFRLSETLPANFKAYITLAKNESFMATQKIDLTEGQNTLHRSTGLRSSLIKAKLIIIKNKKKSDAISSSPYRLLTKENTDWIPLDGDIDK